MNTVNGLLLSRNVGRLQGTKKVAWNPFDVLDSRIHVTYIKKTSPLNRPPHEYSSTPRSLCEKTE